MDKEFLHLEECRFELLRKDDCFLGLGAIWIGDTQVRSGRLPLCPQTQTFPDNAEFETLKLLQVKQEAGNIRILLGIKWRNSLTKLMRDHSFDPIHSTLDWDGEAPQAEANLCLVLQRAATEIGGVPLRGFSYHWEYHSADRPVFFLLDRASWELDGDICGATAISQSSCSAPVARMEKETAWSTEGVIHFDDDAAAQNPVMTHNLPRWASHGSFDFQCKGSKTLVGLFGRVDLIRSLLQKEAGKGELKTFDKHIFDQALAYSTSPKSILLSTQPKSWTDQQNLWTWITDEVHERARAEFGLREEPMQPRVNVNYWRDFTIGTYYRDLLPATRAVGVRSVFIDNINRSDMTDTPEDSPFPGNMCCGHDYEPAPKLGGTSELERFVTDCAASGIRPFSWTNNDQSYLSPLNGTERDGKSWYVKMEDARLKYGGAYSNVFNIWSFARDEPREHWISCLKKIKDETGLDAYLFDSFYNLGFMPVDYTGMAPRTMWRQLLQAFKELQDYGISFLIESFGPFGEVQHGCPRSYNMDTLFACYKIAMGTGYTTVPTGADTAVRTLWPAEEMYRLLAHMTRPGFELFLDGHRLDSLFTDAHQAAISDYYTSLPHMKRRFLQQDESGVLWHNQDSTLLTLWNFRDRDVALPGTIRDITLSAEVKQEHGRYHLLAGHTYTLRGPDLASWQQISHEQPPGPETDV